MKEAEKKFKKELNELKGKVENIEKLEVEVGKLKLANEKINKENE